jgi:hypothetical protein
MSNVGHLILSVLWNQGLGWWRQRMRAKLWQGSSLKTPSCWAEKEIGKYSKANLQEVGCEGLRWWDWLSAKLRVLVPDRTREFEHDEMFLARTMKNARSPSYTLAWSAPVAPYNSTPWAEGWHFRFPVRQDSRQSFTKQESASYFARLTRASHSLMHAVSVLRKIVWWR